MCKRVVNLLVLPKQYSQIEIGIEVVCVARQFSLEGKFCLFRITQPHQCTTMPPVHPRKLRVQLYGALNLLKSSLSVISH